MCRYTIKDAYRVLDRLEQTAEWPPHDHWLALIPANIYNGTCSQARRHEWEAENQDLLGRMVDYASAKLGIDL